MPDAALLEEDILDERTTKLNRLAAGDPWRGEGAARYRD